MTEVDPDPADGTSTYRRPWVRSVAVKSLFRPGECEDLAAIAVAWGVPVATATWAIVAEQLAR